MNQQAHMNDFEFSGEKYIVDYLKGAPLDVIFDVGANRGYWTMMVKERFPSATIHAFEIVPDVYRHMVQNTQTLSNVVPNSYGLDSEVGTIDIKYCKVNDALNTSLVDMSPGTVSNIEYEWRRCLCSTGDTYMLSNNIDYIDFLKIDVEGMEHRVLHGFADALNKHKIGIIQFEYGTANIISRWQLRDYYDLLSPRGFTIAKLTGNSIEFKPYYSLVDEKYGYDGYINHVAIHQSKLPWFK